MARKQSILGALTKASFLLVLVVLLIFLYVQSFTPSAIFPQDTEFWNKVLTGYLVIFALVLIVTFILNREVITSLTKAKYWRAFAFRFIPSALVTSIILIIFKGIFKGVTSINIFQAISYMPVSVLLVHLFVVSQIEELLFGGLLFTSVENTSGKRNANIITMVAFAFWHFAKTGGNWVIMLTYMPLRLWWNYVRNNGTPLLNKILPKFFGDSKRTQQANAGSHFAWNMFIVGFVKPFQV